MNFKALLCTTIILSLNVRAAQCSTNVTLVVGGSVTSASLSVSTGQVARVIYAFLGPLDNGSSSPTAALSIALGTNSFTPPAQFTPGGNAIIYGIMAKSALPVVVGPAIISLQSSSPLGGFCTIEVSDPVGSFIPSNAVVIPADSGGPVNIILESSADLINWTAALPGTYGTSTTNRFFRVRAVRTQ